MAYADYERCPRCDGKAFYSADIEVPDGVTCWHETCLDAAFAEARGSGTPEEAAGWVRIYDVALPKVLVPPWTPMRNRIRRGP